MTNVDNNNDRYKLSIIICCYNKDKTLQHTINSLINQTMFNDMELVFVDDCSTDNTAKILDSINPDKNNNKYNNVKIITLPSNKGVFVARKVGIKNASSKYVGFCDADDYVDKGYYEELYNNIANDNTDIVQTSSIKIVDINGNEITSSKKLTSSYTEGTCDLSDHEKLLDILFNWGTLWNRIYKRTVISNVLKISDDRINYMEDNIITFISLLHSSKYKAIKTNNYYYYNMDNTVYHLLKTGYEETSEDLNKVLTILDNYIKNNNMKRYELIMNRYKYYYLLARNLSYLREIKKTDYYIKHKDIILKTNTIEGTKEEKDYFIKFSNTVKKILNTIYASQLLYTQLSPPNDKRIALLKKAFSGN